MNRTTTATLNHQLTNYAQGHANDTAEVLELAERIAPTVPVSGATGQYKVFDDLNSFTLYKTDRALGGPANRIEFAAGDAYFNAKPQALEVGVDQHERELAGLDSEVAQQLLDQGKVQALINSAQLSHLDKVISFVFANQTPVTDRGNWSNEDVDPIEQLDEQLDLLSTAVGNSRFIKVTMSTTAWRIIRNHPKVKARVLGSQATPLTRQQLVDSLVIPVDLGIFSISRNQAALGLPSSKAKFLSADVLLHYSLPSPTVYDPSPYKVFTLDRSRIASVRTYQDLSGRYDTHAVDWSEDIRKTSTIAMRRIALT
jgi:hypothetical protein